MPVAGSYAELRERVKAAVDKTFAEPVEIAFLVRGAADPGRPPVTISAVLRVGGGDEGNLSGGTAQDWRTRIASGKAELHVDLTAYPDLKVRQDDKVRAVSRRGKPWFQVARVDDRGDTRLVLALNEA